MSEGPTTHWRPRSAWAGIAEAGHLGHRDGPAGVHLVLRDGYGLATMVVCDGDEAALAGLLAERFGWELPEAGRAIVSDEAGLVWSGPGQWLALAGTRRGLDALAEATKGIAAVTDQSDSRACLRISGPKAREMLEKGVALDLHPRAFAAGQAAVTRIAHIGVQLWQRDDGPTYDLAVDGPSPEVSGAG